MSSGSAGRAAGVLPEREVLRYLRLEESDATVRLLIPGSLRYLGPHVSGSGVSHYWSYPTADGVAWAVLSAAGSLATTDEVPAPVRQATAARSAHRMRKVDEQPAAPPLARRARPDRATWVPLKDLPGCTYHEAWREKASFEMALKHYGAEAIRDGSAGPGTRFFYIQLTSGRYACIEARRAFPEMVIISLEVDTRRAGKHSGGHVHVRDIEEVLRPMGGSFVLPSANLFIGWSLDP